jgi:hypothetical protein
MLWVSSDLPKYQEFRTEFRKAYSEQTYLDLSRVPSSKLADEVDSIVNHHKACVVFLGYLEPGWMLEPSHQTRMRKLFRKFPVGLVTQFVESLPFSWKNEIDTYYTDQPLNKNGKSNSLNNGSPLQDQPKL